MATLEEIAKAAQVSKSTVSRVLNNEPRVSDQTRQRVWKVMRELDFHPNTAARALAGRRSYIIGLVIQRPFGTLSPDPYFSMLLGVIAAACEERGYYLMLSLMPFNTPDTYGKIVRGGHLDGLIVYYSTTNDVFIDRLYRDKLPFVLIGRHLTRNDIYHVDVDNVNGAAQVAHHLAALGYMHIATITGPSYAVSGVDRREGFITGLHECGLDCPPEFVQEGDYTELGGYQAMVRLLAMPTRPQAVFAANDTMAVGAIRAICSAGLRVPEDIAIVGFDDMPFAATFAPPLTTVRQSANDMGKTAVTILLDQLLSDHARSGGTAIPWQKVLPVELIVRESCGSAKRSFRTM